MKFSEEQKDYIIHALEHCEVLTSGRRSGKTLELIKQLNKENTLLHSIIKEVREHAQLHLKTAKEVIVESEKWLEVEEQTEFAKKDIHTAKVVKRNMEDILEILDKVGDEK